ncbi:MAG: heavy-metal-associated domain-containing protein [Rhizobacter sp.]|nr:heavy-metal-associated domain-containing protein [Ferruginibacter sp.]
MKQLFIIAALLFSLLSQAQVSKVSLQASGLTCSMCSNAINKSLKSLDYVEKVMANIKTSTFDITFKPGTAVNFDQLKKKVEDAGFFVATLIATVNFNNLMIEKDEHYNVAGMNIHFLNGKGQVLNGEQAIQVVDKGYVSAKAFKKNQLYTQMECYKTGVAGSCCSKAGLGTGARIFHVTI